MPTHDLAALLGATSVFSKLSASSCHRLAALLKKQYLVAEEVLAREGAPGDALFLVLQGSLSFHTREENPLHGLRLGRVGPGSVVGELALLTAHPRAATIIAEQASVVAVLSRDNFNMLCQELPGEMETVTEWMRQQLHTYQIRMALSDSSLFKKLSESAKAEMEASLRWTLLPAGETLFRAGDRGDAMYLVVSGRLRLVLPKDALETNSPDGEREQPLVELGKGDTLGEMALLTQEPRSATAYAIRDTQLARLDRGDFDRILATHPQEMMGLFIGQMAERLRRQNRGRRPEGIPPVSIAVVLASPLTQRFAVQLGEALSVFGSTLHLNRATAIPSGGSHRAISPDAAEGRLLSWLNEQETLYRHVVYETDEHADAWGIRCLRQADVVFLAVDATEDPHTKGAALRTLLQRAECKVASSLVLLHGSSTSTPSQTKTWLAATGAGAHWHLRAECPEDVGRIARSLCGRSVGLALGGGFAYGLAHIGVTQAFRDLNIPVDYVGGTSMGAIIAMTRALDCTHDQMLEVLDKGCAQSLKGDYTLPIVSLLTGKNVARSMGKFIANRDIEDLWLPYFAISTSLVQAGMVVHRSGSVLHSVLASSRAPGVFPPLGWNDEVLVDGGLVNNVPCDVMRRELPTGTVVAVDVTRNSDFSLAAQFDMHLSGWKVAFRKANPFSQTSGPVSMAGIFAHLVKLGGTAHRRQIRSMADLYLEPPLQGFSFRDFKCGQEMSQIAYDYTLQQMQQWIGIHGRPWQGELAP